MLHKVQLLAKPTTSTCPTLLLTILDQESLLLVRHFHVSSKANMHKMKLRILLLTTLVQPSSPRLKCTGIATMDKNKYVPRKGTPPRAISQNKETGKFRTIK